MMKPIMELLSKLFGGVNKVKILRFFVFNPGEAYNTKQIAHLAKITPTTVRKEINILADIGLVKPKSSGKAKVRIWSLDPLFPFIAPLKTILSHEVVDKRAEVAKRFKNCGRIKLLILSGVFLGQDGSRVDLLLVGDRLKKLGIDRAIHKLEAEIGKELNYAVLDTGEFNFRFFSGDKFIRDVFDYPYERLIDRMGV